MSDTDWYKEERKQELEQDIKRTKESIKRAVSRKGDTEMILNGMNAISSGFTMIATGLGNILGPSMDEDIKMYENYLKEYEGELSQLLTEMESDKTQPTKK